MATETRFIQDAIDIVRVERRDGDDDEPAPNVAAARAAMVSRLVNGWKTPKGATPAPASTAPTAESEEGGGTESVAGARKAMVDRMQNSWKTPNRTPGRR
ncbi:MAG TPA: hypothetical protein VGG39_28580 [Polyangiaceae bacterium]|jgi:hypothetical protein